VRGSSRLMWRLVKVTMRWSPGSGGRCGTSE
jgi:hypothetical protein